MWWTNVANLVKYYLPSTKFLFWLSRNTELEESGHDADSIQTGSTDLWW